MSPIYIFICYEMGKIPANIIDFVSNDYQIRGEFKVLILIAILILSLLQIITLLFYLEIFECNFCSLNKNTKKNIEERERMLAVDDIGVKNDDVDNESDIEIKGYIVKDDIGKNSIEMSSVEKSLNISN